MKQESQPRTIDNGVQLAQQTINNERIRAMLREGGESKKSVIEDAVGRLQNPQEQVSFIKSLILNIAREDPESNTADKRNAAAAFLIDSTDQGVKVTEPLAPLIEANPGEVRDAYLETLKLLKRQAIEDNPATGRFGKLLEVGQAIAPYPAEDVQLKWAEILNELVEIGDRYPHYKHQAIRRKINAILDRRIHPLLEQQLTRRQVSEGLVLDLWMIENSSKRKNNKARSSRDTQAAETTEETAEIVVEPFKHREQRADTKSDQQPPSEESTARRQTDDEQANEILDNENNRSRKRPVLTEQEIFNRRERIKQLKEEVGSIKDIKQETGWSERTIRRHLQRLREAQVRETEPSEAAVEPLEGVAVSPEEVSVNFPERAETVTTEGAPQKEDAIEQKEQGVDAGTKSDQVKKSEDNETSTQPGISEKYRKEMISVLTKLQNHMEYFSKGPRRRG